MTQDSTQQSCQKLTLLADEIFRELALRFPVCLSSDEFHFFPQVRSENPAWNRWDNFLPSSIAALKQQTTRWQLRLGEFDSQDQPSNCQIDAQMLCRVLKTIEEQLTDLAPQHRQPTFCLTVLGIGLAEVAEQGSEALTARLSSLPDFVHQTRENLICIPRIFRDQGLEMLAGLTSWLGSLGAPPALLGRARDALRHLQQHLERVEVKNGFLPSLELYERIASRHIGCDMATGEIALELDREINETRDFLEASVNEVAPGVVWPEFVANLPSPQLPAGGVAGLYRATIRKLADHCVAQGLASRDFAENCPVRVESIPDYMLPVRSNAAYSMPPGHPTRGGTFFIMESCKEEVVSSDYRLLSAHETFPGHHLLDGCRWNLTSLVRRPLEFPIFYEGWASFSEELLFDTGFFSEAIERILLAKRRFWRAMRGRVDLDIHTRRRSLDEAAAFLVAQGLEKTRAMTMVRRYIQKPGYQLAYTIGRRRFRKLYDRFLARNPDPVVFARKVLEQGEIGFDHLEKLLMEGDRS